MKRPGRPKPFLTLFPSEFEDGVDGGHTRVGAAGAGCTRSVTDPAEVLEFDAHARVDVEEVLRAEAGKEAGVVGLKIGNVVADDCSRIVNGYSRLGKKRAESPEKGEIIGERNRRDGRKSPACHFVKVLLGDPSRLIRVLKVTERDVIHLAGPITIDLVSKGPLETRVEVFLAFVGRAPGAEVR